MHLPHLFLQPYSSGDGRGDDSATGSPAGPGYLIGEARPHGGKAAPWGGGRERLRTDVRHEQMPPWLSSPRVPSFPAGRLPASVPLNPWLGQFPLPSAVPLPEKKTLYSCPPSLRPPQMYVSTQAPLTAAGVCLGMLRRSLSVGARMFRWSPPPGGGRGVRTAPGPGSAFQGVRPGWEVWC